MDNIRDIIGELATPDERRAGVQRAYDDGYDDGRLDVNREHEARIAALKQALWDVDVILGSDHDGDPTPAALVSPPLIDYCLAAAREHRKDYDDACDEVYQGHQEIGQIKDQVDYWRNLTNIANADVKRLRELLALQIEQADEAVDEAYKQGHSDGWRDAEEGSGRDL